MERAGKEGSDGCVFGGSSGSWLVGNRQLCEETAFGRGLEASKHPWVWDMVSLRVFHIPK